MQNNYFILLYIFSHSPQSASIEGNTRFAPAWLKTSSFNGPVLAATVKRPAATPAVTPRGAYTFKLSLSSRNS